MRPKLRNDSLTDAFHKKDRMRRDRTKALAKSSTAVSTRNDILPMLRLVDREPGSLKVPAHNVRAIDPAQVRRVANSISTLGFSHPVLIAGDEIIDGVSRIEAAKLLKAPTVPCIETSHLSSSERELLRVSVNRLGERGVWDLDQLAIVMGELLVAEMPLEISGFDGVEIDAILADAEVEPVEQGPLAPESNATAVTRPGDVYVMGDHKVICGDALDAKCLYRLMAGERARIVLTDEPYNVPISGNVSRGDHREFAMASGEMTEEEFRTFNEVWIRNTAGYLVDGGVLASFIDWRGQVTFVNAAQSIGLTQFNLIVWGKTNAGMGSHYRSQHELLPLFKKGNCRPLNNVKLGKAGRSRTNLWTYAGASSRGSEARKGLQDHPTVKPVAMLNDALLDMTARADIVLDPFLGSGSTLIAAEKTGRACRGIEIDPLYVDVIVRRYEAVTGRKAVLEDTGETFQDVQSRRYRESKEASAVAEAVMGSPGGGDPVPAGPVFRKRTRVSVPMP